MSEIGEIRVSNVTGKAAMAAFVNIAYLLNARDPYWVPPLRQEVFDLFNPAKNPFHAHATVQPMIATRNGKIAGRISAHIDHLATRQPVEQGMGPGTGNWGMLEAEDNDVARALMSAAEDWLRAQGMTRALGPISLSIWDEPGLLVRGHDHSPTVMMGHDNPAKEKWVEEAGYRSVKSLYAYQLNITEEFTPLIQRIIKSGENSGKINVRSVDKSRFDEEAAIILAILNDAWSDNWGFVPLTDAEIAHVGKKLKPLVREDLIMIAELDGEPVAFMITLPDLNEAIKPLNGSLFPFGWAKLLLWLRHCRAKTMRVPLMGVKKELQSSRMAGQLAFMMIEYIRRNAIKNYGSSLGELGWILEDNQGMVTIADAIGSTMSREYRIYEKVL